MLDLIAAKCLEFGVEGAGDAYMPGPVVTTYEFKPSAGVKVSQVASLGNDLARLLDTIDREVDENTPGGVFVTLFVGILDTERRMLRYINAGHNPQFVLRSSGSIERLSSAGLPVGLYPGQGYAEHELALGDADLLFFYTDGMVEAENDRGEMFSIDRLEALLLAEHQAGVDDLLDRIERTVREFRGTAEPFDDATMMALRLDQGPALVSST